MTERKVKVGSDILLYREKAPFVESGVSIHGALEYDEADDLIRCHECGEWHTHLSNHIWLDHAMRTRAYKIKHGLNQSTALCNERIRQALVAHGRSAEIRHWAAIGLGRIKGPSMARSQGVRHELRNRNGSCRAQALEKIQQLAETLGRTPYRRELPLVGLHAQSVEFVFGLKLKEVISLAGLKPRKHGEIRPEPRRRYSDVVLIEMLRDFWVRFKRLPSSSDCTRGLLPCFDTFERYFGSMEEAYRAAGLEREAQVRKIQGARWYTVAELESILSDYVAFHGRLPTAHDWDSGKGIPTRKTFGRYVSDVREFAEQIVRKVQGNRQNQAVCGAHQVGPVHA